MIVVENYLSDLFAKLPTIQSASKSNPFTNVINDLSHNVSSELDKLNMDLSKLKRSTTNTISDALNKGLKTELNKAKQGIELKLRKIF